MKKLILFGGVMLSGLVAFAQGTVNFNNRVTTASIDAPVRDMTGALAQGPNIVGQLYAGADAGSLAAVGSAVAFRTGAAAGYVNGGTVVINSVAPGATAFVQMRAWDTSVAATYEAALAAGIGYGQSSVLSITTGGAGSPPSLPANLTGLAGFSLVIPEPSTIALGLLGAAGLLLARRSRK